MPFTSLADAQKELDRQQSFIDELMSANAKLVERLNELQDGKERIRKKSVTEGSLTPLSEEKLNSAVDAKISLEEEVRKLKSEVEKLKKFIADDPVSHEAVLQDNSYIESLEEENTRLRMWVNSLEASLHSIHQGNPVSCSSQYPLYG